jgi:uncharacterized protein (TIGR00251 family)
VSAGAAACVSACAEGVWITVRVQPKASRDAIVGPAAGALKVAVTAPPAEGAANAALIELLAKRLGVAKSRLEIASGQKSRNKLVLVRGAAADAVLAALAGGAAHGRN